MLRFNDYKNKINENDELIGLKARIDHIQAQLSYQIDQLVGELKKMILSPEPNKRGFFDHLSNWWHNLFGNHNNPKNPYYWQNKIGALGKTESTEYLSITEYNIIKNLNDSLKEELTGSPLPIISRQLDAWGQKAKNIILAAIQDISNNIDHVIVNQDKLNSANPTSTPKPHKPEEEPIAPLPPREEKPEEPKEPHKPVIAPLPPREEKQESTLTPEQILDKSNRGKIQNIVKGTKRKANINFSPEENLVLNTIWDKWAKLKDYEKEDFNKKGGKKSGKNRNNLRYAIPWVLRTGDPRIEIIRDFYPEEYKKLLFKNRIETLGESEEAIQARIKKFQKRSNEEEEDVATPQEQPMEKNTEKDELKLIINNLETEDDLRERLLADLESATDQNDIDRIKKFINIIKHDEEGDVSPSDIERESRIYKYKKMLTEHKWDRPIKENIPIPKVSIKAKTELLKKMLNATTLITW